MIPVKLSLRNFMSYGDDVPPLDFNQFHVACLSGDNGNGKSAILNAMVWALWGEGRKASGEKKADAGLLRIGALDMRVEFEFDLEGDRYCVIREFKKTRKGSKTNVDFLVYDQSKDEYITLSESSSLVRTQRKINSVLNTDYRTFINSAFILQGRANEFTKKSPWERKEILSEILGLSKYEFLSKAAKAKAQDAESALRSCGTKVEEIDRELSKKELYHSKIGELEDRISSLSSEIESLETEFEALSQRQRELRIKRDQVHAIDGQISGLDADMVGLGDRLNQLKADLKGCEDLMSKGEEIKASYGRYGELKAEDRRSSEALLKLRDLEREKLSLESRINEEAHRLESEKKVIESNLGKARSDLTELGEVLRKEAEIEDGYRRFLEARADEELWREKKGKYEKLREREVELQVAVEKARSTLESELRFCGDELSGLREKVGAREGILKDLDIKRSELERVEGLEKEKDEIYREGTSMRVGAEGMSKEIEILLSEMGDNRERLRALAESVEAKCPLCESRLSESRLKDLNRKISFEIESRSERISALKKDLTSLETEREALRNRYRGLESEMKSLPELRTSVHSLESSLHELDSAQRKIGELEEKISVISSGLESERYTPEERSELEKTREGIRGIGYDRSAHDSCRKMTEELEHFRQEKVGLDSAKSRRDKIADEIPILEDRLSTVTATIDGKGYALEDKEKLSSIMELISDLGYDGASHRRVQSELDALRDAPLQMERLEKAKAEISKIANEVSSLEESLAKKSKLKQDLLSRKKEFEEEISASAEVEAEIKKLKLVLSSAKEKKELALQEKGKYQGRYDTCLELESERKKLEAEGKEVGKKSLIYNELSTAFGKDGIQSLIIESTIPELEDEANYILSRLTDNRTHITIEPLRDLKKGGTKETLDIKISDEVGTRDYELYSGGEAFRTDFAIRIGLSKLLARRAGARLRTLVIDEGFGTQDSKGLQNLIEAIQSISSDFDKIIVVTHLEELRNAFPVRIEVEKSPDTGSRYSIVR